MKKKIAIVALVAFIIIQFVPVQNNTSEFVEEENKAFSTFLMNPKIEKDLKIACYDCHSNSTHYPWYSKVAPINFWLKGHIKSGKKHLNFSEWEDYDQKKKEHKLSEIVEVLKDHSMPLKSYTWLHSEAKWSLEKRQNIINYIQSIQ